MIKKIDHIVLTTNDFDECKKFYQKLGFTVRNSVNRLEMFAGDMKINVHQRGRELSPHAENVAVGSVDICFEVTNLEEFIELLDRCAIGIELGIVAREGARGDMNSVYIRDCDGNLLEFCSYQ